MSELIAQCADHILAPVMCILWNWQVNVWTYVDLNCFCCCCWW